MGVDTPIEAGDIFVKRWGQREIILVMLPRKGPIFGDRNRLYGNKQPFVKLHLPAGRTESTWNKTREAFCRRYRTSDKYHYMGTVPEGWIPTLMRPGRGEA